MRTVVWGGAVCRLDWSTYQDGRRALRLVHAADGSPMATASVNLPEEPMAEDEMAIKSYSGNAGLLTRLIEKGIVSRPLRHVQSGYVEIPICRVLVAPDDGDAR